MAKEKDVVWFALNKDWPLCAFAGIWTPWTGTRGTKANPVEGDHLIFGFLTTEPNAVVAPVHAKAMPVILTTKEERDTWMRAFRLGGRSGANPAAKTEKPLSPVKTERPKSGMQCPEGERGTTSQGNQRDADRAITQRLIRTVRSVEQSILKFRLHVVPKKKAAPRLRSAAKPVRGLLRGQPRLSLISVIVEPSHSPLQNRPPFLKQNLVVMADSEPTLELCWPPTGTAIACSAAPASPELEPFFFQRPKFRECLAALA